MKSNFQVFKEQVGKTRTFLSSLMAVWESPSHDLLALLLQNLSFDGSECINYNFNKDFKKCEDIVKALKELKGRSESCPVTQYICEEVDLLYTGYVVMGNC